MKHKAHAEKKQRERERERAKIYEHTPITPTTRAYECMRAYSIYRLMRELAIGYMGHP